MIKKILEKMKYRKFNLTKVAWMILDELRGAISRSQFRKDNWSKCMKLAYSIKVNWL